MTQRNLQDDLTDKKGRLTVQFRHSRLSAVLDPPKRNWREWPEPVRRIRKRQADRRRLLRRLQLLETELEMERMARDGELVKVGDAYMIAPPPPPYTPQRWGRDGVIAAMQRLAGRYGRQPSATDLNPGQARANGQDWRAERFERDGDYPGTTVVQYTFGSWNAAVAAAGFEPRAMSDYPRAGQRGAHLHDRPTNDATPAERGGRNPDVLERSP